MNDPTRIDTTAIDFGTGGAKEAEVDDVMTVVEAAKFLKIGRNALYDAVARGAVPCRRIGKKAIRFSRAALLAWLDSARGAEQDR